MSNPSSACFHKPVLPEITESIREMIAHNMAAIAELTERIKALDTSISRLAAECYPETIYLQQVSGVGPIPRSTSCSKSGIPAASSGRATSEPSWACVRSETKAERPIITHFQMRRSISATPASERRPIYSGTLRGRQRAARVRTTSRPGGNSQGPRSGPWSPSHESSPYCSSRSGNPVKLTNPSPLWLEPV